jgi:predicted ATP-grasp superfamily ATP-dependent carboligase
MDELITFWEKPASEETVMIVGWRQWADAGAISSKLPEYLIEQLGARKIGEFKSDDFYLFQVPGTHHFLRPVIKLEEGYPKALERKKNEIFYSGDQKKGIIIFLGDEPHLHVNQYGDLFFTAVKTLNIKRVVAIGGVYGPMPYDKDRQVSCTYSLRGMKEELDNYAVRFSNYEGGATIGSYLVKQAEQESIEFLVFYGFVPAYDFSHSSISSQEVRIEQDYKAWYDLVKRFNHMFGLRIDLSDLQRLSDDLVAAMDSQIDELDEQMPQLQVRVQIEKLGEGFTERPFMPLGDVWQQELDDLFSDLDD